MFPVGRNDDPRVSLDGLVGRSRFPRNIPRAALLSAELLTRTSRSSASPVATPFDIVRRPGGAVSSIGLVGLSPRVSPKLVETGLPETEGGPES
jgi:hypothetical protein